MRISYWSSDVCSSDLAAPPRWTTTFLDVRFNVWDLSPGNHRLSVDGHVLPEPLEVAVPGASTGLDLVVEAGETLTGVVVDGASDPVPGATITARGTAGDAIRSGLSGSDGRFSKIGRAHV